MAPGGSGQEVTVGRRAGPAGSPFDFNAVKKDNTAVKPLVAAVLIGSAVVCGAAAQDKGPAKIGAAAGADRPAPDYPGCVKVFNGKNFDGWEADPSTWSIVDGAMRGVG